MAHTEATPPRDLAERIVVQAKDAVAADAEALLRATCCAIHWDVEHLDGAIRYCIAKAPQPHNSAIFFAVDNTARPAAMVKPGFLAQPASVAGVARAIYNSHNTAMMDAPGPLPSSLALRRTQWEDGDASPTMRYTDTAVLNFCLPEEAQLADYERAVRYMVDVVKAFQPAL